MRLMNKLNAVTKPDPFPIPRIDDLLDGMSTAKFYYNIGLSQRILASPHGSSIKREDGLFHNGMEYEAQS